MCVPSAARGTRRRAGVPSMAQVQWMTDFNGKTQWRFMIMGGAGESVRFFPDDCGSR